jgi:hypothetical protein
VVGVVGVLQGLPKHPPSEVEEEAVVAVAVAAVVLVLMVLLVVVVLVVVVSVQMAAAAVLLVFPSVAQALAAPREPTVALRCLLSQNQPSKAASSWEASMA